MIFFPRKTILTPQFWTSLKRSLHCPKPGHNVSLIRAFFAGDEILSVNGHSTQGLSHSEAIAIFKGIRSGKVTIQVARRDGNYTK